MFVTGFYLFLMTRIVASYVFVREMIRAVHSPPKNGTELRIAPQLNHIADACSSRTAVIPILTITPLPRLKLDCEEITCDSERISCI